MGIRVENRDKFLAAIGALGKTEVTKAEVDEVCQKLNIPFVYWFTKAENRVSHGKYRVPSPSAPVMAMTNVVPMTRTVEQSNHRIANVTTDLDVTDLVPRQYKNYVPFGNFEDVFSIVNANRFFPVFISGHSGNGKTMSIEQACARAKRKFVCVSMTPETDEGDLLGNYVLKIGRAHV